MARGKVIKPGEEKEILEQFPTVDDEKLRLSLVAMSDKYNEKARRVIKSTYDDPEIASIYRGKRNAASLLYKKNPANRRKIVEFPNQVVYDFVDTVLSDLYGPDWLNDRKALKHQLVRPWWVVKDIDKSPNTSVFIDFNDDSDN